MTATALPGIPAVEPRRRDGWSLARFEGRKLLTHPLFLGFAALSGLFTLIFLTETSHDRTGTWHVLLASGPVEFIPFAAGVLIAAHLAASRSRHDGTDEFYGSLPSGGAPRVIANLASVGWAVGLSLGLLIIGVVASQAWSGLPVALESNPGTESVDYAVGAIPASEVTPSAPELAQVPLAVAVFGLAGVALAVWVRSRLVLMLLPVLVMAHLTIVAWGFEVPWRWFLPFASSEQAVGNVEISADGTTHSVVQGFNVAAMAWHDLYLLGLGALLAGLALARFERTRRVATVLVVGAALAGLGGALQLGAYTPSL